MQLPRGVVVFPGRKGGDVLRHKLISVVETFSISFLVTGVSTHLSHYPLFLSGRVSVGQFCGRTERFSVPDERGTLLRVP